MKIDWTPMKSIAAKSWLTRKGRRNIQTTVRPVSVRMLPMLSSQ
jgi:hypothetical protein